MFTLPGCRHAIYKSTTIGFGQIPATFFHENYFLAQFALHG